MSCERLGSAGLAWGASSAPSACSTAFSLHVSHADRGQFLLNNRQPTSAVRSRKDAVGALYVAVVLHKGESSWGVSQRNNWTTALAVVPSDIQFVAANSANHVLRVDDALVGMALEKELATHEVTLC